MKAIQLTETSFYVTVSTREAKESLLSSGVSFSIVQQCVWCRTGHNKCNTIKDAPFELSDGFLIFHMKTYGYVIGNSLERGKIRGTEIETDTRYIQMVNVRDVLPTVVNLGRFRVRIFSDNKTECRICKGIRHAFFRCPQKNDIPPRVCGRCKSTEHRTRECTNDIVCNYCDETGHKQRL